VYAELKALMETLVIDDFFSGLEKILTKLHEDSDTKVFWKYFQDTYVHRAEEWSYCFRLQLGINTNMYNESMHKTINYGDGYLEGKKGRRLDIRQLILY